MNNRGKVEYTVKDGVFDGLYKEYDANGVVIFEATYKMGKLDGVCIWRYSNGRKLSETTWKDGYKHGSYTTWYKTGELCNEALFYEGSGTLRCWYPNGVLRKECRLVNGKIEGKCVWYHENGVKAQEMVYEGGVPTGVLKRWDERGLMHVDNDTMHHMIGLGDV